MSYTNSETSYVLNYDLICSLSDPFYLCAIMPPIFSLIVPPLSFFSLVPLSLVCWLKTCYSGRLVPVGGRKSSLPFTRHIIYSRPWVGLACLWSCCHSPSNSMSGGRTVGKQVGYQTEHTAFLLYPRNYQIEVWCISIIILGSKHISWSDKSFEETKEYFNRFLTWLLSNIFYK